MTKRRIIRSDSLNWSVQEFQEGGAAIERGRFAGQIKQARWKAPESFFRTLADAARDMFHETVGDGYTGEQIAALVDAAEKRVKEHVSSLLEKQDTGILIGILQERGFSVTDGRKGRKSYVDEKSD